jgi:pantoate--beta-alanine ligase
MQDIYHLLTISKKTAGVTVCSIFINPTQFNDPRDFQKYPVTLEKDIALLEQSGTDVLFLPEVSEVYPDGTSGLEHYDLGRMETLLEGKYRPGHFQGVCQVMRRLLDVVRPDDLFMGQKDYQQCMVVQRLLELRGMPTRLHRCPILREAGRPGHEQPEYAVDAGTTAEGHRYLQGAAGYTHWAGRWASPQKQRLSPQR